MKPAAPRAAWPLIPILLLAGAHVLFACWNILYSGQNADEGFYALAARGVWQGEVPYRDFCYTQMPLLPYVNGLVMQLIGFGLFEQRAVNGLWGALTLLLVVRWLAPRTSPAWALGFGLLLSLSATWMGFIHLGKTYALVGLIMLAAVWVYSEWTPGARKVISLAFLATLGIGCRLTTAPFFAILWLGATLELPLRPLHRWGWRAAGSLLWPVILLLPFYLAAPEAAYFWTMGFHRLSVPNKPWHMSWQVIVALAPALWLGLVLGWGHAAMTRRWPERREGFILCATLVAMAFNLLPAGVYEEYGVPFLPPLLLLVATGLWRAGFSWAWLRRPLVPLSLIVINLSVAVGLLWRWMPPERHGTLSVFLPLNASAYDSSLAGRLARQVGIVREYLPAGSPFIGPQVILAVEAGRPVPQAMRMGPFTATFEYPAAEARRLNLVTFTELEAYFNDPRVPLLAFYKNGNLNYAWSMPSFHNPPLADRQRWQEIFHRDFLVAYEDADTLLLVRKSSLPAGR
jgi:4-amino-4-deoxy-L-arabinose transferase-like glycosyltransferase